MPRIAPRIEQPFPATAPQQRTVPASGGTVAVLQRTIEERLAAGELLPMAPASLVDRAASSFSRVIGFVALAAGYTLAGACLLG